MRVMRHCMQILRADQMLIQQHGLKPQLNNSYTRGVFFPRKDQEEENPFPLVEWESSLDKALIGNLTRPGSQELYLLKEKVQLWFQPNGELLGSAEPTKPCFTQVCKASGATLTAQLMGLTAHECTCLYSNYPSGDTKVVPDSSRNSGLLFQSDLPLGAPSFRCLRFYVCVHPATPLPNPTFLFVRKQ